jgi:regulator of protease activity HflC (stomatin/prohibitin superfamily)
MEGIWQNHKMTLIALAVVVVAIFSTLIVVPETQQAVIIRTGEPIAVVNKFKPNQPYGKTGAGIWWRIPFFDRVEYIDKRVLSLNMQPQQVLSTDQLRLNVDAYARYRIIDPVKMVQTAGTVANVETQLAPILSSVVRQELGRRSFASLLTAERGTTMQNIRKLLDTQAREYGAQVIDVRIKRADLPARPEERPDHPRRRRRAGVEDLRRRLQQGPEVLRFLPCHAELRHDFLGRRFEPGHPFARQRIPAAIPRPLSTTLKPRSVLSE